MIKRYKLPIQGTALKKEPLTGARDDPICVIPLSEIDGRPTYYNEKLGETMQQGCAYTCLNYNLDEGWCEVELEASEEFHNWLANILPQLRGIQEAKGWKLDKANIEKVKGVASA
ncbi:hypothetical protein ES703_123323 [subsurface metagenome]